MKKIGVCVGQTKPNKVNFVSDIPLKLGQFVILEYEENNQKLNLLGMIQSLYRENPYIAENIKSPRQAEDFRKFSSSQDTIKGEISIIGKIIDVGNQVFLEMPKTPPLPASSIYEAPANILRKIFGEKNKNFVRIGRLLSEEEEIPVFININQVVLRHLAILAITGAGKSNTVSVLLKNIVNLGGTAVVFDFHGEYAQAKLTRNGKNVVNKITPFINPAYLKAKEFASFIGIKQNAHIQYRYFRKAFENLIENLEAEKGKNWQNYIDTETFLARLKEEIEKLQETEDRVNKDSLFEVLNKLEDTILELGHIIKLGTPPLIEKIKSGYINVFDFSEFDEEVSDTIASNLLRWGLEERKKAVRGRDSKLPFPVLFVIEEAHILAGERIHTDSKYWISRIAREGRKFGIGLTIVTQRPKGLDKEILSQMNNMIILKLVEPDDQRHVQKASEALSSELMEYLPSLNPGEAIIIGNMTKIPLLVKIDKAEEKIEGHDIDVVNEWTEILEQESSKKLDDIEDILDSI